MRKKITASFDELLRTHYGSAVETHPRYSLRADDLLATYYGVARAPKPPAGRKPTAVVLSTHVDDGRAIPPRRGAAPPASVALQQTAQHRGLPQESIDAEYRVEVIDPVRDVIAASPAAGQPSPPPPAVTAAPPAPALVDEDFVADLESILKGQKVFDPTTKKTVEKGPAGPPPPAAAPQPNPETAIFDRLAQSLQYANAYNLGTIELENRFNDFERIDEIEKTASQRRKTAGAAAAAPPPVRPAAPVPAPVDGSDFIQDLDAIRNEFQAAAVPAATQAQALTQVVLPEPKSRPCCVFGAGPFSRLAKVGGIVDVRRLNTHDYFDHILGEQNGIVYTCRGGFVDTGHVRDHADRTAFLAVQGQQLLPKGGFFHPEVAEGGALEIQFNAQNVTSSGPSIVIPLAQRIAHEWGLWHEIVTWCLPPHRYSAFAPEDLYSNLLGTWLAAKVLRGMSLPNFNVGDYSIRMAAELPAELNALLAVSPADAQKALDFVDVQANPTGPGWWDSGRAVIPPPADLVRRRQMNAFDSAKTPRTLTPWLVPGFGLVGCAGPIAERALEVPDTDDHGTSLDFYYTFRVNVNTAEIPARFLPKPADARITSKDFPAIVEKIRADVRNTFPNGDQP